MNTGKSPWDYHPDLTEERLITVADVLAETRNDIVYSHNVETARWGFGCLIYDQTRSQLIEAAKQYSWLNICDPSMSFVFQIGAVPIRFYRGLPDEPNPRTLAVSFQELSQMSIAFEDTAEVKKWRFAVSTDVDGTTLCVTLAGFSDYDDVICQWDYHVSSVIPLAAEDMAADTKQPVEQKPATATPKQQSNKIDEVKSG